MSNPQPPHDSNPFKDLSGISTDAFSNPYDALISACNDAAAAIQEKYTVHRTTRNAQQKAKILASDFPGVTIDPILLRLHDPTVEPGYEDPRNCLVFWGRPTTKVKSLVQKVQEGLLGVAPNLWLMPQNNLHITCLEITHSKTPPEISHLKNCISSQLPSIVSHTLTYRARLIKPMLSYDASAIALSFVPAAGEALPPGRSAADDVYSYHHLRRDLYEKCVATGVQVDSRYVVPSAHLTIARFIQPEDVEDKELVGELVKRIEQINELLRREYWPSGTGGDGKEGRIRDGGEWIMGEERGLDCRMGKLWYGDGETILKGEGF